MSGTSGQAGSFAADIVGQDTTPPANAAQFSADVVGQTASPVAQAAQFSADGVAASWYQWHLPDVFTTVQAAPERPFPLGFKDYPPPPLVARFGSTGPFL